MGAISVFNRDPTPFKSIRQAPHIRPWEAARAANKANTIAAVAVALAIIAIIISTFSWIYLRH
jgi:hypothetical protein